MPRNRIAVLAVAGLATLSGVSGIALGHGGGHEGDRGGKHHGKFDRFASCTLTDAQKLTAENTPALARKKARLDAALAAGRITKEVADARLARAQTLLSLAKIKRDAQLAPVLTLLKMTEQDLMDAIEAGDSLRDLAEEAGVSRADLRQALRDGRMAARAAVRAACPVTNTKKPPTTTTPKDPGTTTGSTTVEAPPSTTTTTTGTTTAP